MISIVTPVYNEEDNVVFFHDEVTKVMEKLGMDYELIYVNDGSRDRTDLLIHQLASHDPHVRALTFARNFGHQIAITCGMDFARGDAVITMDGDMQHPPALIPKLIEKWEEGYDIVQTVRTATEDAGFVKKLTSSGYYAVINSISTTRVVPGGSDFRLMDRKALDTFLKFREHSRFIRGIVGGLGFKQTSIEFTAPARHAGVSKFSMKKMLHFAMDGIITNSTVPLRMAFYIGLLAGFAGFLVILHVLWCVLMGEAVPGWATMTILISIFGGLNLMCLGVLGEYMGHIFEETRNRPLYWLSDDTAGHEGNPYRETHEE
ncbi:glycosyltransferase family 2 protein [uncultured Dialister sp.]|jgi:dolichol-phosphate mannosyltransferase|uniref:glycosyltransferase family 2 protein n=1 Tax=uncultured Dialister sp. TaxID=278064 RepID=UPI0025F5AB4C|nr:glycosyltransferase family 2 protein [uncultured Dialister sp.]